MLSLHQLHQLSGVFDNSGWPKRMGEYKNEVCKAKETGGEKKQYLKFLFLIRSFPKAGTQKEQPWWNHSVALWAETHWLWPFCHHSLNNTHPDNKASSMPQLFSSKPVLLQVQSAALPSQDSLSFPLQMGFAPAPNKRYKESQRVYMCWLMKMCKFRGNCCSFPWSRERSSDIKKHKIGSLKHFD